LLEIALSCFDLLVRELQSEAVDASRVVLIGMSVGGGLVIDVAARGHGIAAVAAIVPYLDGTRSPSGRCSGP